MREGMGHVAIESMIKPAGQQTQIIFIIYQREMVICGGGRSKHTSQSPEPSGLGGLSR